MSPASSAVAYYEAELGRRLEAKSNLDEVLNQILGRPRADEGREMRGTNGGRPHFRPE